MSPPSLSVRLTLAVAYLGVFYYNNKYVFFDEAAEKSIFTSKYVFLTTLNLTFLTGVLVYGAICYSLCRTGSTWCKIDGILGGASAAMSMFVFVIFWILYTIDRELVYPLHLDEFIPTWHNHALHSAIVPVSLLNYCLVAPSDSPSFLVVQLVSVMLGLAYIAWIFVIHTVTGYWTYPVLEYLSSSGRMAFIVICCLSLIPFAWLAFAVKRSADSWSTKKYGVASPAHKKSLE